MEQKHLDRLAGFPLSGLATTHEAGYESTGGHTVHFRFKVRRHDAEGRLVERKVTLSVSRGKGVVTSEPSERVLQNEGPGVTSADGTPS